MNQKKLAIQGIIFDVYNTLISRSMSDFVKLKQLLPPNASVPTPESQRFARTAVKIFYSRNRHLPWALEDNLGFWQKFYELYISMMDVYDPSKRIAHELAGWSRDPRSFVLDSETIPLLTVLRQRGFPLGLLSNWDTSLPVLCGELGLAEHVDMILASDEIGIRKPDREIFIIAGQRLGVPPESCLFVGDSLQKDVVGGKKAGMKTAWFNSSGDITDYAYNERPDIVISRLAELVDCIQ